MNIPMSQHRNSKCLEMKCPCRCIIKVRIRLSFVEIATIKQNGYESTDEMSMTVARSHRSMIKSVMVILSDNMNQEF